METIPVLLDFGHFTLDAELFDSPIAKRFAGQLPCAADLAQWGAELYGPIGINLGEENPVPEIPPGGIAYTREGNLVCIFFGQTPAWEVEYIGRITGNHWRKLPGNPPASRVTIRAK